MTDPIRIECPSCGLIYTENHARPECPHEPTTSFTKALRDELKRLLALPVGEF
jgi:rubredoxin